MKILWSILLLLAQADLVFAQAGGGTRGGAMAVVMKNGRVALLDLIDENQSDSLMDSAGTENFYLKLKGKSRFQKRVVGGQIDHFFDCALPLITQMLEANQMAVLKPSLTDLKALSSYYPFPIAPTEKSYTRPVANHSERFTNRRQIPAAAYSNFELHINQLLYDQFDEHSRCGLAIHEAYRFLNSALPLYEALTTNDIEALTRYTLGIEPADSPKVKVALNRLFDARILHSSTLSNFDLHEAQLNKTMNDFFNTRESPSSRKNEATENLNQIKSQIQTIRTQRFRIDSNIEDLILHLSNLSTLLSVASVSLPSDQAELRKELQDLIIENNISVMDLSAGGANALDMNSSPNSANFSDLSDKLPPHLIYQPLPAFKWYDILLDRIVTRATP